MTFLQEHVIIINERDQQNVERELRGESGQAKERFEQLHTMRMLSKQLG